MKTAHTPSLLTGEDLAALSAATEIPIARLRKIWAGQMPTYFDAFLMERATGGRIKPESFRSNVRRNSKRTSFHGERVWGSSLGRKLAGIIVESGLTPRDWFLHHGIRHQTVYTVLMNGRIPRPQLSKQLISASNGRITHDDLYRHQEEQQARSGAAALRDSHPRGRMTNPCST